MPADLFITDYGVSLATGNTTRDLMLACMAGLPLLTPDTSLSLNTDNNEGPHQPVLLRYSDNTDLLADKARILMEEKAGQCDELLFILPDKTSPQYEKIKPLACEFKEKSNINTFEFSHLKKQMELAIESLEKGKINQFTVFSIDNMTGMESLFQELQKNRLRSQLNTDGYAMGEGLGWFTLSKTPSERVPMIRCHIGDWISEPAASGNSSRQYNGVALSIKPLLQYIGSVPDTWVYSRHQTPEDDLEAFMAFQHHWGNSKYQQLEQLLPARQIGDLGIAALPVAIALACERLDFKHYRKTSVVISDSHPDGHHFSLLLTTD